MSGGGEGEGSDLQFTPTWVVALVCTIIVAVSFAVERSLHRLGKYLKKKNQKALFQALQKIKEELMILGFISLFLAITQNAITKICVRESWTLHMLPCSLDQKEKEESKVSSTSHFQRFFTSNDVFSAARRLLADDKDDHPPTHEKLGYCAAKGKVPLFAMETLHHLHIFIFVLAVVHVTSCVLTIIFGGLNIRRWKHWEDSIVTDENIKSQHAPERIPYVTYVHQHEFIQSHFTGFGKDSAIMGWVTSFFKQFYGSVMKLDYVTLRLGFIMTHCKTNPKFNFHKYMNRALEDDFKKVVGISWYLWIFVVIFMLLNINVNGWHAYLWIAFIPFILLLAVGTKLEHVIIQLAHEVAEKHTALQGELVVQPSDYHFCFHRPRIVLFLIHLILFQNSFEIAYFFWIWVTYGFNSCIMGDLPYTVPRLVIGVFVQVVCSYSTLPLYAIITQMGTNFKNAIFDEQVQVRLAGQGSSHGNGGNVGIQLGSAFRRAPSAPENNTNVPKVVRRQGAGDNNVRRRVDERRRVREAEYAEGHQAPAGDQVHPPFPGGPTDTSLLIRYDGHVARHLWFGEERHPKKKLKVAAHGSKLIGWVPHMLPPIIEQWLGNSGLSSLQRTSLSRIDQHLVSAFVERWHPETSSFHMPFGEMTITLDDVSCLLHVPIRGELVDPAEGFTDNDAIRLAIDLMGVSLEEIAEEVQFCRGPYYRLDWLKVIFERQRAANRFDCAARAYMMVLLGCTILTDKTFTLVEAKYLSLFRDLDGCGRYCWGAAALVNLYRYLGDASFYSCKQLGGYASLLQCWIHEYFPSIGKRGLSGICGVGSPLPRAMKWCYRQSTTKVEQHREQLDALTPDDVIWRPFKDHRHICPFDDICLYKGGLKWYGTAMLYLPDRCLRQFGYKQYIPHHPPAIESLDVEIDWLSYVQGVLDVLRDVVFAVRPYDVVDEYIGWYYMVSHPRLVAPPENEEREIPVPVYAEGPEDERLAYISGELHRYLQRHNANEEDDEFIEIFRSLRVAQGGPLPQGGPIPYSSP